MVPLVSQSHKWAYTWCPDSSRGHLQGTGEAHISGERLENRLEVGLAIGSLHWDFPFLPGV